MTVCYTIFLEFSVFSVNNLIFRLLENYTLLSHTISNIIKNNRNLFIIKSSYENGMWISHATISIIVIQQNNSVIQFAITNILLSSGLY